MNNRASPTAVETAALLDEFERQFPQARADVVARWGSADLTDLVVQLAASSRWGDEAWSLYSIESIEVVTAGPLAWIEYHQSHTGMNWYYAVHGPTGFASCKGAQALELMLPEFMPDVVADAAHIMTAYETIGYARVLRTAEDIAAQRRVPAWESGDDDDDDDDRREAVLPRPDGRDAPVPSVDERGGALDFAEDTWPEFAPDGDPPAPAGTRASVSEMEDELTPPLTATSPAREERPRPVPATSPAREEGPRRRASADVVRLLEPPHLEGRHFVFCAHQYWDGVIDRITIDIETYAVEVAKVGDARRELMPMGRAYVADDGPLAAGFSPPAPGGALHPGRAMWAALWRAAAQGEHASVASFARASMELMAIGAPLSLVERTHAAALDEIRHTRFACAQACAHDGQELEIGALPALPARPATVATVLQTTLEEAAIPETYNAIAARVAADACRNDALRDALGAVADDEERHADLAFDVIEWCLTQRPELLSLVTSAALDPPRLEIVAASGHGFLDAAGRDDVVRRGRERLVDRIRQLR